MKGQLKTIILSVLFACLIGLPYILSYLTPQESPSEISSLPAGTETLQVIAGVHIIENSGPNPVWELWASTGSLDRFNTWRVYDIKVNFFSADGETYEVTAPEGIIGSSDTNEVLSLKLSKNVITKSSSGYVFYSDNAEYLKSTHELVFPGEIKITGPQDILLTGKTMTLNLKTNEIKIHKEVFSKIKDDNKTINLSANESFIKSQNNTITFKDDVVIVRTEVNILGNLAVFNFSKKVLLSAEISEDLFVIYNDKLITAEKLSIDFIQRIYTFQGNGKAQSGEDIFLGDEIVIEDDGKKIKVKNAKGKFYPKFNP